VERWGFLLEGPDADPSTCIVLELKMARRPALHGLVPVHADHRMFREDQSNGAFRYWAGA
jgi:hypothetical protein